MPTLEQILEDRERMPPPPPRPAGPPPPPRPVGPPPIPTSLPPYSPAPPAKRQKKVTTLSDKFNFPFSNSYGKLKKNLTRKRRSRKRTGKKPKKPKKPKKRTRRR